MSSPPPNKDAATLAWCAHETRTAVERAARASEDGVLAVGRALDNLTKQSRSQTTDLLEVLPRLEGGGGQAGIGDAIRRQTNTVQSFVEALIERSNRQNEIAERASRLTASIASLARDVAQITITARILSLNARIESSRLGESGKAMAVVAGEIREVSSSVAKANDDIADLASQLNELLPSIARLSVELSETSREFNDLFEVNQAQTQASYDELMSAVRDTVGRAQDRAENMLAAAQGALSALNFQDPMVQSLRQLAGLFEQGACSDVRLDPVVEAAAGSNPGDAPEQPLPAGEVALF